MAREGMSLLLQGLGILQAATAAVGIAVLTLLHRERFQNELGVTQQAGILEELGALREASKIRWNGMLRGKLEADDGEALAGIGLYLAHRRGWESESVDTLLREMVTNDQGENLGVSVRIADYEWDDEDEDEDED
jgi:hypothetical protein